MTQPPKIRVTTNLAPGDWSPLTQALAATKQVTIPSPIVKALAEQAARVPRLPLSALRVSPISPAPVAPPRSGASVVRDAVDELTKTLEAQGEVLRALAAQNARQGRWIIGLTIGLLVVGLAPVLLAVFGQG